MNTAILMGLFIGIAGFTFLGKGLFFYTLGIYMDLPNVIVHECGHALTARLWGGSIKSVTFHIIPSIVRSEGLLGQAIIGNRNKLGSIFSTLGGYVSQSLFFLLVTYLDLNGQSLLIIPLFLAIYLVTNLLAADKSFWQNLIIFAIIASGIYLYQNNPDILLAIYHSFDTITAVFIVWYMAGLAHQIFIVLGLKTNTDWDGSCLAKDTYIPAVIWKILFLTVMVGAYFSYYWITSTSLL